MPDEKAVDAQTKPAAQVPPAAGSAPAPKEAPAATGDKQVEAPQTPPAEPQRPPKGVEKEFFKLREKVRSEKAEKEAAISQRDSELAALKARLEAFEKAQGSTPEKSAKPLSETLFEDPDKFAAETADKAVEKVQALIKAAQEEHELTTHASEAAQWLLTRSHVKQDPSMKDAIRAKIDSEYKNVADINPKAAANSAYLDVCREKGIVPDWTDYSKPSTPTHYASSGIAPTSAAGGGEAPVITAAEAHKYSDAELKKAIREGRYQGKFYQI